MHSTACVYSSPASCVFFFFFFNDPATPEIYPLPLHDPLPIFRSTAKHTPASPGRASLSRRRYAPRSGRHSTGDAGRWTRSEEHTSELQSRQYLVCRLLLEKKKNEQC